MLSQKATDENFYHDVTSQYRDYISQSLDNVHETTKDSLLRFIFDAIEKNKSEEMDMGEIFTQLINAFNKQKEIIISLSDFFIQKGIERGIEKGRFFTAKNILHGGSEPSFIERVTGVPMEAIRGLQVA